SSSSWRCSGPRRMWVSCGCASRNCCARAPGWSGAPAPPPRPATPPRSRRSSPRVSAASEPTRRPPPAARAAAPRRGAESAMSLVNYSTREITCKIVYYGPGRSGKTTNLQHIHGILPEETRGRIVSLATEMDRTLFFDFLPLDLGRISGFQVRFQLYTVPGQVYYDATRRLVLQGADGVVFVADSQPTRQEENVESFRNLQENLLRQGVDPRAVPVCIQYNKRDLPEAVPVAEMERV